MSTTTITMNSSRLVRSAPRGFVAGLTPRKQVDKVIADMANLEDGDALRN
jgi:hypothetical protein